MPSPCLRLRWLLAVIALACVSGLYVVTLFPSAPVGARRDDLSLAPATSTPRAALTASIAAKAGPLARDGIPAAATSEPALLEPQRRGARVTGSVLDAWGGPIAGAVLTASDRAGKVQALGISDSSGLFRLDVVRGDVRIVAHAEGYSEPVRELRAPVEGVRFVLAAASAIVGRVVVEGSGAPVAGVVVTATGEDGLWARPRSDRSGPDGKFQVSELSAGRYSLVAASEHGRSEQRSITVGVGEASAPVELTLHEAIRLRGRVQLGGVPCPAGAVILRGPVLAYAELEADGSVGLDGLVPGRYDVNVSCEGVVAEDQSLDVGSAPLTHVWDLDPGLQATGIALTPDGAPVARARIDVVPVGEPFGRSAASCSTDEHGEFSCAGLAEGPYDCSVGPFTRPRGDSVHITLSRALPPRITLRTYAEGAIRVHIAHADGLELPALSVVARRNGETRLGELFGDEFVFEPLALGNYEVSSDPAPAGSALHVELTRPRQVAIVTLPLPAAHTLSGRVIDAAGEPIADAWVRASSASLQSQMRHATPVLTDAEGAFSLPGLIPGRYRLDVSSDEGEAVLEGVASDERGVMVRVQTYASLSGRGSAPPSLP